MFVKIYFCSLSFFSNSHLHQVIRMDGGELPALAGEFNMLNELNAEQWDQITKLIRSNQTSSWLFDSGLSICIYIICNDMEHCPISVWYYMCLRDSWSFLMADFYTFEFCWTFICVILSFNKCNFSKNIFRKIFKLFVGNLFFPVCLKRCDWRVVWRV